MRANYTAVTQQHGQWWIGWVEEVPGVNPQGQTRDELLENLRDALDEALEMNRAEARAAARGEEESGQVRPRKAQGHTELRSVVAKSRPSRLPSRVTEKRGGEGTRSQPRGTHQGDHETQQPRRS